MLQKLGGRRGCLYMHYLIHKYRSLSPTVKASLWFIVCNVILKATQVITIPIYTRILPKTEYGEYTVFLSWVEIAVIFTTLDIFYNGYNVGLEKFREDRDTYTTSMHGLCIALTTLWIIVLFPFVPYISGIIKMPTIQVYMLLLYMYIFPVYQFWSARKRYEYQYKSLIVVTTILSVITILLGYFFAIHFENKSNGVVLAKILAELIIAIPLLLVSLKGIKNIYNKYYWKYALKFNIPLVPHYLSTMILNHSDRVMISTICGKADAGIYSVTYSVAMLMTIVQNAISSSIIPWMNRRLRKKQFSGIAKTSTIIILIEAFLNLAVLIVSPEVVRIISTEEYYDAVYIIPPITFGVFLTGVYGLFVVVEFYFGYNKIAAIASTIAAISNVILNYIFIRLFGYMAAGYTTFASYLLLVIMHYYGIRKVAKLNEFDYSQLFNMKIILCILLGFGIAAFLIYMTYGMPALKYGLLGVVLIVSALMHKRIKSFVMTILEKEE